MSIKIAGELMYSPAFLLFRLRALHCIPRLFLFIIFILSLILLCLKVIHDTVIQGYEHQKTLLDYFLTLQNKKGICMLVITTFASTDNFGELQILREENVAVKVTLYEREIQSISRINSLFVN